MILSSFTSWDYNTTWKSMVGFAIICVTMLLGNTLRRKIPFLRRMLIPTAVIAGFIGLGLKYLINAIPSNDIDIVNNEFFEYITYHMIAIGFIAMTLKASKKEKDTENKAVKSGLLIVGGYLIQGVVGLTITIGLGFIFKEVAQYGGLLLPMGYGQGPGQANNVGQIFEQAGFVSGKAFGLSIATLGFICACIPGVLYINYLAKKGIVKRVDNTLEKTKLMDIEDENEIPECESVDKLTIQICFVGLIYLLTYLCIVLLSSVIDSSGVQFLIKNVKPLLWGFNFIFAILFTMLIKAVVNFLRKNNYMTRQYTNDYMLNRISGFAFDLMIATSIMAIEIESLNSFGILLALVLCSIFGGLVTFLYCRKVCKNVYPDYYPQATASMFGMLSGTASTGIALLREIDPNFETPASNNMVTGSSTAVIFGAPILLLVGFIYNPEWYWLWGSYFILLVGFIVIYSILMKKNKKVTK